MYTFIIPLGLLFNYNKTMTKALYAQGISLFSIFYHFKTLKQSILYSYQGRIDVEDFKANLKDIFKLTTLPCPEMIDEAFTEMIADNIRAVFEQITQGCRISEAPPFKIYIIGNLTQSQKDKIQAILPEPTDLTPLTEIRPAHDQSSSLILRHFFSCDEKMSEREILLQLLKIEQSATISILCPPLPKESLFHFLGYIFTPVEYWLSNIAQADLKAVKMEATKKRYACVDFNTEIKEFSFYNLFCKRFGSHSSEKISGSTITYCPGFAESARASQRESSEEGSAPLSPRERYSIYRV